jgi:hypothetical protein
MVARVQPSGSLAVSFFRDGDPPETIFARDGKRSSSSEARRHAGALTTTA